MKQLHYVLIAQHLTGDSSVHFFPTSAKAQRFFDNKVTPLLEICYKNKLEEDDVYSFGQTKNIVRFDIGYNDELDALLGECNHYYRLDTIEVDDDVTHYVAEFSEWVDESNIKFFTENEAREVWNDKVDDSIVIASHHERCEINRYNQDTWESDGVTVFQQTDEDNHSDAYFGFSTDFTWTYRIGKIEMGV
jgi:hypothetical protein